MIYLAKPEVMAINYSQIRLFGGDFVPPDNLLGDENVDYLLEAGQAEMFGEPLYPEIHQKAGLYRVNITGNHIFQDGSKRTHLQAAIIFLMLNSHTFAASVSDDLLTQFTLTVASAEHTPESVQDWFECHIRSVS